MTANASTLPLSTPVPMAALDALRAAQRVLVFSGAGMSADSGIPTFRESQSGLWERFSPEELASPEGWETDPSRVWAWYEWRRGLVTRAQPNAGHDAVARLAELREVSVVTQNVDDLHERAGSEDVVHLHGSLFTPYCQTCAAPAYFAPDSLPEQPVERLPPPRCGYCGGSVRPGVVWFGEGLPMQAWDRAKQQVSHCDLMLVVGTSGTVYPAAGLVTQALREGKAVIEINPDESELSNAVTLSWHTSAAQGLPMLLQALNAV